MVHHLNQEKVRKKLIKIYIDFINSGLFRKKYNEDNIEFFYEGVEVYYLTGQGNKKIADAIQRLEGMGKWYRRLTGIKRRKMTKKEAKKILKSLEK